MNLLALTLALLPTLLPTLLHASCPDDTPPASNGKITPTDLVKIAPKSASCNENPTQFPAECASATEAAPFINEAFEKYNVSNTAEKAAVVALMAFESAEFKYNRNHWPGRVGQGTRNMQMATYNLAYAQSLPHLTDELSPIKDQPGKVLDLLLQDESVGFASGAWFLVSQCSETVRGALQSGSQSGWEGYIGDCVGTGVTEGRRGYWDVAREVLGVES